ncbi:MAG: hypothetical protein JNK14_07440 [Chitinophagaceae bacterium]|nr:hypothetical protein [Chitinophagaceae bacterium]
MRTSCSLLTLLLLTFSCRLAAQFTKGTRMAGASVASIFVSSGTADQTVPSIGTAKGKINGFEINLTPSIGWFVSGKTVAGVTLNLNPSSEKISFESGGSLYQKDKISHFNLGIGGFVRSYLKNEGSLIPFGQFNFSTGFFNEKSDGFFYGGSGANTYKRTYSGKSSGGFFIQPGLSAGITKMINSHTGLDVYAGYNFSYSKSDFSKTTLVDQQINGTIDETEKSEYTSRFSNHRFLIGIGFQVFLERKK